MARYSGWENAKPKNRYSAKMTRIDGIMFDSKAEAARYQELKLMKAAGLIDKLDTHPSFPIDHNDQRICVVELDFRYWDEKETKYIFEDVKGVDNALSALKRKLVENFYRIKVNVIHKGGTK
jgi:hypothetical protein